MKLAEKYKCCGCAGCYAICPFDAITMKYDEENFIYPVIDDQLCKNCGKCTAVCPIINNGKIEQTSHNIKVLQGFYKDDIIHRESASGGAATAFAEMILDEGGCVFGSAYYNDYRAAHYVKIYNKEELKTLKGSKYIETEKDKIYTEVKTELDNHRVVLFTGLPCDIGGLKYYLNQDYENLYTCELICHGPTAQIVQKKYIDYLERKMKSNIIGFNSRYNMNGTERPYIRAEFENGKCYLKPLWDTEYGYGFAVYNRNSCYQCNFKGNNRLADISVGDSWRAKETFGDNKGVSVIYAHTDKGLKLVSKIGESDKFQIEYLDYKTIKKDNPAIYESLPPNDERKRYSRNINKTSIIITTIKSKKPRDKIKYIIKKIISKE
jgi:coenzyme F420-reducing hydrogenase beta subunit